MLFQELIAIMAYSGKKIFFFIFIFIVAMSLNSGISILHATAQGMDDAYNLCQEGYTLFDKEDYNGAVEKFSQALKIYKKLNDVKGQATCLAAIGYVNFLLGKFEEAKDSHGQALTLNKVLGDKLLQAGNLNAIAGAYFGLEDYKKAIEFYEKAHALYKELGDKKRADSALLNIKASYVFLTGKELTDEEMEEYQKAFGSLKESEDKQTEAARLLSKSAEYFFQSHYQKCLEYYLKALKIYKEVHDLPRQGIVFSNIGKLYFYLGDYKDALGYFHKAFKVFKELHDIDSQLIQLNNIADSYKKSGEETKAYEYYTMCIEILKERLNTAVLNGESYKEAAVLSDIGVVCFSLEKYTEAIDYYNKALSISKDLKDKTRIAALLTNIASAYFLKGSFQKTADYYKEALVFHKEIQDLFQQASDLLNIGLSYERAGSYKDALSYYMQSQKFFKEIGFLDAGFWTAWRIAYAYKELGDEKHALAFYKDAIGVLEKMRAGAGIEKLKTSLLKDKLKIYEEIIQLLIKQKKNKEAFLYSEKLKSRAFIELLLSVQIKKPKEISLQLKQEEDSVSLKIRNIYEKINNELAKPADTQDRHLLSSLFRELRIAQRQLEDILDEISILSPSYASLKGKLLPMGEEEVAGCLDKETALIQYCMTENELICWVISNKKIYPAIVIDIGRDELIELVFEFRQPFEDIKDSEKIAQEGFLNILKSFKLNTAQKLYEILIKPAEGYLNGSGKIIIVPDGILNYLPFEALVYDRENAKYLVEKYSISYLPSASFLDPKIRKKTAAKKLDFLGFGNPSFSLDYETGEQVSSLRGNILPPLKFTAQEIGDIGRLWRGNKKIYLEKDANEFNAKQNMKDYNYIHFATHGLLDEANPLFSGIVLALPDPTGKEDGYLETHEIFNIPLSAELVVLSACETGLGKIQRGEGVIGLTRAFMYAGALNIVVTLWSVDDRATSILMKSFYGNMLTANKTKAEALRSAKLELIMQKEYAHPYFWAPFILIGDGR